MLASRNPLSLPKPLRECLNLVNLIYWYINNIKQTNLSGEGSFPLGIQFYDNKMTYLNLYFLKNYNFEEASLNILFDYPTVF